MDTPVTEREKMLAGRLYRDADPALVEGRRRARELVEAFNAFRTEQQQEREAILRRLLGRIGAEPRIEGPFYCDYGTNISIGDYFYANYNCAILDCGSVTIGDHVRIGPNAGLFPATHPLLADQRRKGLDFSLPVVIGNDVWIGGNCVVNPGVSIGDGAVIGSGSVVCKDIPPNVIAVGNPCRVLRPLTEADRMAEDE